MGVGALVVRDGVTLPALVVGGGQERRRRSGTENIAGIAGFGAAAEAAAAELAEMDRIAALRDHLEAGVYDATPDSVVIGKGAPRLANTTVVALSGQAAETMVIKFDLAGIAVSAGSACSSGKVGVSHVLTTMGVPEGIARGAIRISLGWNTTAADVDVFLAAWRTLADGQRLAVA
jgi:cysteine desulfurase